MFYEYALDKSLISNYNMAMTTSDIISLISKIRTKVNRHIELEMSRHGMDGIATSHGDILYALFGSQRMTMAELAARIGRDKSTVTALVNKLETLGYVSREKSTEDTRVTYAMLTQKGALLKPVFEKISDDIIEMFYKDVSDSEKDELLRILKKIYSNL
jgi:DNA-binding MarR family transcriptional regulator